MNQTPNTTTASQSGPGYHDGPFDHTLPNGRTIRAHGEMDLFDGWRDHMTEVRDTLAELVRAIDRAYIRHALEQYRKLAARRGRLRVIWTDKPVDVCFTPKEAQG